jgi:FMN reductase
MTADAVTRREVVVVQAGLGQPSSTRLLADRLAGAASDALLERGIEARVRVVDLRRQAQALASTLLTGFATGDLRADLDAVATADGVIAVTPVFQASYSGLFKTFVDVLDDGALRGTPVLMAATAGTARHSLVLEHAMRPLFSYLKAVTVPTGVFAASEDWGADGAVDAGLSGRVQVAAEELADLLTGGRPRPQRVDEFADPVPFEQLLGG